MNNLSWMIYLISMFETLREFLVAGLFISGITVLFTSIFRGIANNEEDLQNLIPNTIKLRNRCAIAVAILAIMISIIPKKETMILIAASEIGERVITSETAQEIAGEVRSVVTPSTELLRVWIEEQTRKIRAAAPRAN